jgi:hypothetical protein
VTVAARGDALVRIDLGARGRIIPRRALGGGSGGEGGDAMLTTRGMMRNASARVRAVTREARSARFEAITFSGAVTGATMGAVGGLGGVVAGGAIGTLMGALTGVAMGDDELTPLPLQSEPREREPDESAHEADQGSKEGEDDG